MKKYRVKKTGVKVINMTRKGCKPGYMLVSLPAPEGSQHKTVLQTMKFKNLEEVKND